MCGILGHTSIKSLQVENWIKSGLSKISHRGPDDSNLVITSDKNCVLAHCRLSIIDLSSLGSQPMFCPDANVYLAYNGEIYNYKEIKRILIKDGMNFFTETDTEVVLKSYIRWGTKCFSMFTGMFAFAIYDGKQKKIILCRDRAGEKPLFYYKDNDNLYFGSELKAILENSSLPRNLSYSAFDSYLCHGYVQRDQCILNGYNKLRAGHFLEWEIQTNKLRDIEYWSVEKYIYKKSNFTQEELFQKFDHLLNNSVKKQLRSDVQVGVLLSGGVDSSLITAYAAKFKENINTYTISFLGSKNLDESNYAANISRFYKTNHHVLEAKPDCVELLPLLARQFDEPMVDSSMIPTFIVCQLVSKYCKVVLGGDGGDEIFGGYPHYSRLLKARSWFNFFPKFITKILSKLSDQYLPHGINGKNYLSALQDIEGKYSLPLPATHFDPVTRSKILSMFSCATKKVHNHIIMNDSFGHNLMKTDFCNYLSEDILVKIDRSSMANSIEMRAPLLDHNIIEFAFTHISEKNKFSRTNKKIFLKEFCKNIFPATYNFNRKQGFEMPITEWLKSGRFRKYFEEILYDRNCMFDPKLIILLFTLHDIGFHNSERLFSLLLFELWRNNYNINMK